jgi:hypothetical protein
VDGEGGGEWWGEGKEREQVVRNAGGDGCGEREREREKEKRGGDELLFLKGLSVFLKGCFPRLLSAVPRLDLRNT